MLTLSFRLYQLPGTRFHGTWYDVGRSDGWSWVSSFFLACLSVLLISNCSDLHVSISSGQTCMTYPCGGNVAKAYAYTSANVRHRHTCGMTSICTMIEVVTFSSQCEMISPRPVPILLQHNSQYQAIQSKKLQRLLCCASLTMAMLGMNHSLLVCALALVISGSDAFAPRAKPFAVFNKAGHVAGPLLMAEDGSDEKITITSGKKEIAYDAKSGRFFETNLQEEECIPDEEYCVVDPESGQLIRLTVAEKERIFLDALQVSVLLPKECSLGLHFIISSD